MFAGHFIPVSTTGLDWWNNKMPRKPLITLAAAILLVVLIIFANTTESPSEGISGASEGTSKDLEKDLPKEEKIPTH